ncbi:MAG: hypothetical protein GY803_02040, partial [Chloroflexi bacterium]|nr:hypothetical protein [Chloroflexota bacterium]
MIGALFNSATNAARGTGQAAYWKLDEVGKISYAEEVSNHLGQCAGVCPASAAGQVNGGQRFDGATTGISIPTNADFDWGVNDSFSVELWVKGEPGQTCADNDEILISRKDSYAGGWSLGCRGNTGKATFQLEDSNGISLTLQSSRVITDGLWHHLAAVRDGTTAINAFYIDGSEVVSATQIYTGQFAPKNADVTLGYEQGSSYFQGALTQLFTGETTLENVNDILRYEEDGGYFQGALDEVALYSETLPEKKILEHYYLSRAYTASCTTPVTIMPLGDSITRGYGSGDQPENYPYNVAYRRPLYLSLVAGDYYFNFVGGLRNGQPSSGATFDYDHEGNGGKTDDWVANRVFDFLTAHPAEVVLLHIGTNGLHSSATDVENILDEIDRFNTSITVVLARITDWNPINPTVTAFNNNVEAMALARIDNGDKIVLVDQQNALNYPADLYDALHPNETGYGKMAGEWLTGLGSFLPTCTDVNIVSEPITIAPVGEPYAYSVDAIGNPDPAYSLLTGPTGMSIDPVSGAISWTPNASQIGEHSMSVMANNGSDSDQQDFTVEVRNLTGCTANMLHYWKLDETSGTNFKDCYGEQDAAFSGSGSPGFAGGQVNGALDFNGTNQRLITGRTVNPRNEITVMAWINPDDLSSHDRGVVSKEAAFILEVDSTGNEVSFSLINVGIGITDEFQPNVPANTIAEGVWTHLAATYDGTKMTIYINGQFIDDKTTSVSLVGNSSESYYIGWSAHWTETNRYFDGRIDDVAIFEETLSPAEIQAHYEQGIQGREYCDVPANITSTEVTKVHVNQAYSYDVNADGVPAPAYS